MKTALIYALHSTRNGEIRYIGQTIVGNKRRLYYHIYRAGRECTAPVHKWIRREMNEGYKIELSPLCIGERNVDEKVYIARARSFGWRLLNLTDGGDGGDTRSGTHHTEETKKKMRASSVGKNKGKVRTQEYKDNVSKIQKELWKDPAHREKIILTMFNRKCSEETKNKIIAANTGNKKLSEAVKKSWILRKQRMKEV